MAANAYARPRGVDRAEVIVAFTPTNVLRYVKSIIDGMAVRSFEQPQGGMQAHYLARWVTRRNAIGPWSETSSATVAAWATAVLLDRACSTRRARHVPPKYHRSLYHSASG